MNLGNVNYIENNLIKLMGGWVVRCIDDVESQFSIVTS